MPQLAYEAMSKWKGWIKWNLSV